MNLSNIAQARFNMIEQQIRPWNVLDTDILALLAEVPREDFVPAAHKALAFADLEIPLGHGECMLAPRMEARLLQDLQVQPNGRVLEIGAGSGYMAALLAHKARHVTSIEINPELKALAQANLARAGVSNVSVEAGDGSQGWSAGAPFDVIVISGALEVLPEVFLKQVKVGGRIAAIIGAAPAMSANIITRVSETAYDTVKVFETEVRYLKSAETPSHFEF